MREEPRPRVMRAPGSGPGAERRRACATPYKREPSYHTQQTRTRPAGGRAARGTAAPPSSARSSRSVRPSPSSRRTTARSWTRATRRAPSRRSGRSTTASRASSALRRSSPSSAGRPGRDPPRVPPLASRRQRRRGDARHRHDPRRVPERHRHPRDRPDPRDARLLEARMTILLLLVVFLVATAYFSLFTWLYDIAVKKGWLPE